MTDVCLLNKSAKKSGKIVVIPVCLCGECVDNFSSTVACQETATPQIKTFHIALFTQQLLDGSGLDDWMAQTQLQLRDRLHAQVRISHYR